MNDPKPNLETLLSGWSVHGPAPLSSIAFTMLLFADRALTDGEQEELKQAMGHAVDRYLPARKEVHMSQRTSGRVALTMTVRLQLSEQGIRIFVENMLFADPELPFGYWLGREILERVSRSAV